MEDIKIVELYFARDERALDETERKYGSLCFHVARNILCEEEDVEECVNDTYLAVWNSVPPNHPESLIAYMCKIVRNQALKKLEHINAKKRKADMILSLEEIEETLPDERILPDVNDERIGELINGFLRKEKEVNRNVFLRRYWFFDSIRDISERYSLNENTVKSILFRTRNRLRDYLRKEGICV